MKFDYSLDPIDRVAKRVTNQEDCYDSCLLDREGMIQVISNISKRREIIKEILGIKNKRKVKNLMYMFNKKGRNSFGYSKDRNLFLEFVKCGTEIEKMKDQLKELK